MMEDVYNDLTQRLDELSDRERKIKAYGHAELFRHYLYEAERDLPTGEIAIRVPGGTVGTLFVDEKGNITNISIAENYIVKYEHNVNLLVNEEFVGKALSLIQKGNGDYR